MNAFQIRKIQQNLGLALRASKCVMGDKLMDTLGSGRISLVLLASDASQRTKSMFQKKCEYFNIPIVEVLTIDELSYAIGKTNRVAVGIADQGFSQLIRKNIDEEVTA